MYPQDIRFLFAYHSAMGRWRQQQEHNETVKSVILTWRMNDDDLLVNFLNPASRLPVTRQRVYQDRQMIVELMQRSHIPLRPSPRRVTFMQHVERGHGEVEIWLSPEQYAKLTGRGVRDGNG